jgi:A/G-specific adenine glycosylase
MNSHLVDTKPPWITVNPNKVKAFQSCIIDWYSRNNRNFPWRETNDPFHVLIAEILLKLTGAWKVVEVYPIIIERFGTPQTMANADVQELRRLFQPLGLYERASLLKGISDTIIERFNGAVPTTYDELITLNGIGTYTANAILCLAYRKRTLLVDGSTSRIFSRCFQYISDKPAYADKKLWELAERFLPDHNYREYNLGLLDLGAAVCKYPKPRCSECPLTDICNYSRGESISMKDLTHVEG